jgi:hypothetical protein
LASCQSTRWSSGTAALPMTIPVSSATSRTQVSTSDSASESFEPVTLCQKPGASARSSRSTSSSALWMTTRTDSGIFGNRFTQVAPWAST